MGNIILSNSFIDVTDANITARTSTTGYPKIAVMDRWNLKRRFRANDVTANDYLLKFDFTTAKAVLGIFLNDVNFNQVKIEGNATDSWGTPSFPGTTLTVSQNKVTGRYQIYIPLTGFNLRWLRLFIPVTATAVGGYTSKWEIGTVCFLSAVTTLSHNMSYGYGQSARHFFNTSATERIKTAEALRWEGSLSFDNRSKDHESDLWALGKMDMSKPFVFYENRDVTNEAYLCVRDDSMSVTEFAYSGVSGSTIKIKEVYMLGEN